MKLTSKEIEEGICPTCRGHGSYGVNEEDKDGNVEVSYKYCEACGGTGLDQSNGDFD